MPPVAPWLSLPDGYGIKGTRHPPSQTVGVLYGMANAGYSFLPRDV